MKIIELKGHEPDITESLYVDSTVACKLIHHREAVLSDASDLLMVNGGLPGNWRCEVAEPRARELAQTNRDVITLLTIPSGVRRDNPTILNLVDYEETGKIFDGAKDWANKDFTLRGFLTDLSRLVKSFRNQINNNARINLVGQSYGALPVLWTLKEMQKRQNSPAAVTFLSPFTAVSLAREAKPHRPQLSIVNTEIDKTTDTSLANQISILKSILDTCRDFFRVKAANLAQSHRDTFRPQFFTDIEDLRSITTTEPNIRVLRGGQDASIGPIHTDFIAARLGTTRQRIETVLPNDDHGIESIDFADLLAAK